MGWQTESVVQLIAGNTIINPNGTFVYNSSGPGTGNLIASETATAEDEYGNFCVGPGWATYGSGVATLEGNGFFQFYSGTLGGGWTAKGTITSDSPGDITILAATGRSVLTNNNTLDDGAGNMSVMGLTVNGSTNTGSGNNGGVTSGPSGTTSSFPAAGPNHTHAEVHQHPF